MPKLAKGHKQQVGPLFSQDRLQDTVHRTTAPVSGPNLFQQSLSPQLEEEVASLLQNGAVEEIHPISPGFYSRIFLVPKKNGKVRLIIDLSTLNRHVFIQSSKMETLLEHRHYIMYLITSLGLTINYQKSDLIPTQIFTFIGMEFLTYSNIVRVPHPRVQKLLETIMIIYQKTFISARVFLSLFGQLSAAADFVMLGRLHLRPLQMSLLSQWRPQNFFTESPNQDISEHFTPSRLVEAGRDLSTRSALEDKSPLTHNIYGRQPVGLGFTCGTGRTTVSWSLDGNPISATHKYAGNDGHFNGTKGSSSHNQEFHCVSLHRQHNSSGLSEK